MKKINLTTNCKRVRLKETKFLNEDFFMKTNFLDENKKLLLRFLLLI